MPLTVNEATVAAVVETLKMPLASFDIKYVDDTLVASSAYTIVDVHGFYEAVKPFEIHWPDPTDLLGFTIKITDGGELDAGLNYLRVNLETSVFDAILSILYGGTP
jgi:hypothetical protein